MKRKLFHSYLSLVSFVIILPITIFIPGCNFNKSDSNSITVVSYGGGAWQESHQKAIIEPFIKKTGVKVTSVVWDAEYGKLKTMVETGNVKWDVVEVTAAQYIRGKNENLFELIPFDFDPNEISPGPIEPYGVANIYWATVLAYMPDTFPKDPPKTWADFWNIKKYPGYRALYDDPRGNLEFALLADGVDPNSLYPLDVDRAFKSLDRIKPYIRIWWKDASQSIQLLVSGQVVMSSSWNGRLFAARRDNTKIAWSWDGAAQDIDFWVIPRGAPAKKQAKDFVQYAIQAIPLAEQAKLVGYGPPNQKALEYLPKDLVVQLPTYNENFIKGFVINSKWWSENETEIQKRWIKWKAK